MKKQLVKINAQGELVNPALLADIRAKYKPDSPFLMGVVPYVIMAVCALVDGCFFYSLFSVITYDRPVLLWVQIAGFIFGFDCLPVFVGMHYKKLKQGLTKDKFTLWLALTVCALICATNIGLRAVTVDAMSPDLSESSQFYFAEAQEEYPEEEEDTAQKAVAWMIAITGMVVPIVTSVGSFYISNLCYDPLMYKKQQEEKRICQKRDQIRRLQSMICAYEADQDFEHRILEEDAKQYAAAGAMTAGLLLEYHGYLRQRLMPLSAEVPPDAVDDEAFLDAFYQMCTRYNIPVPPQGTGEEKKGALL